MEDLHKKTGNGSHTFGNAGTAGTNKRFYITIAVAVLLIAAVLIWKSVEVSSVKDTAEKKQQDLKAQATRQVVQLHEEHLKLLAKPFVWSVREDMLQGNLNQLNLFTSDMVKEKNFQRIVIANDKGIIISSTNKKDEGQPFSTVGKDADLNTNDTKVENVGDSILIMTSPIMGFNNRLGTLLLKYTVQPPSFK